MMDQKKIGSFLKQLRNERGITQEQLAETFGVSGRTVSRWETGTNLPDLSILIELSEYYEVDIKEIFSGERKSETMKEETKEVLQQAADYTEAGKQKVIQTGNLAFAITFLVCAAAIVIQLLMSLDIRMVLGETAVMLIGGLTYLITLVYSGVWDIASGKMKSRKSNVIISVCCATFFATIMFFIIWTALGTFPAAMDAILFCIVFSAVDYLILRLLSYFSERRKRSRK